MKIAFGSPVDSIGVKLKRLRNIHGIVAFLLEGNRVNYQQFVQCTWLMTK